MQITFKIITPHVNHRTHYILGVTNSTMKIQIRHALASQFSLAFLITQQRRRLACSDQRLIWSNITFRWSLSLVNALFICMTVREIRQPLSSRTITNHLLGLPSNWQLPFYCCLPVVACIPCIPSPVKWKPILHTWLLIKCNEYNTDCLYFNNKTFILLKNNSYMFNIYMLPP